MMWVATERGRQFDATILKELAELRAMAQRDAKPVAQPTPTSADWNPLKVHLVLADTADEPAVGYKARMKGSLLAASEEMTMDEKTDPDGIADFGMVHPGQFSLTVTTPWGEEYSRSVVVKPGLSHLETVPCPQGPPADSDVSIAVDWPDDLAQAGYWIVCEFSTGSRRIGDHSWQYVPRSQRIAVSPAGEFFQHSGTVGTATLRDPTSSAPISSKIVLQGGIYQKASTLCWPAGTYQLFNNTFVLVVPAGTTDFAGERASVISPDIALAVLERRRPWEGSSKKTIAVCEVTPGQTNLILVPLSDETLRDCRVAFAIASLSDEAVGTSDRSGNTVRKAASCFVDLDRNRNGGLSQEEFAEHVYLSSFHARAADLPDSLSFPLSRDQFVRHFLSSMSSKTSRSMPPVPPHANSRTVPGATSQREAETSTANPE